MTDPREFEIAVLDEVVSYLAAGTGRVATWSRDIQDVSLEGEYPATRIVVKYKQTGSDAEKVWSLWDLEFEGPDGNRLHPSTVGTLIATVFEEPS